MEPRRPLARDDTRSDERGPSSLEPGMSPSWTRIAAVVAAALPFLAPLAAAQDAVPVAGRTAQVVAGKEYRAGPLKGALLGRNYRDLWTSPVTVPVLDLR